MSPSRLTRRFGATVALSLAAPAVAVGTAGATPSRPAGGAVSNHQGTLPDGATWTIDVPERWNGDPLVTVQHEDAYARTVADAGSSSLLRQAFTARGGHCTFTPAETVAGLHALLHRVEHGHWDGRPPPGGLNVAATALGPDQNVHFDDATGTLVPRAPAYAPFEPTAFLRPFDRANAS